MNEAELLFSHILSCDRAGLYAQPRLSLSVADARFISAVLRRRIAGEPLQYIIGRADFYGYKFYVDRRVLIPRPETELLVEAALRYIDAQKLKRILDIGTGSGCIAISIAKSIASACVTGLDISADALAVAQINARRIGVAVDWVCSDMCAGLTPQEPFDLIVSNPPYISFEELSGLAPEVMQEPAAALQGGDDGLLFYRRLAVEVPRLLVQGGMLLCEIGWKQSLAVQSILQKSGEFRIQEVIRDYAGIERIIVARKGSDHG